MTIMSKLIFKLIKFAYATILRDLVKKAIDDPESEVDDMAMEMLDRIFDYNGKD